MKRGIIIILITQVLLFTQLNIFVPGASATQIEEYTLKAVYIEKFTRFVEWPEESEINDTSKPFIIGIIGENPFESTLRKIFSDKTIKGKKVLIHRISGMDEIAGCHLLLISKFSKEELRTILSFTKKHPVLTISDSESFAGTGVLINFYTSNNKLRFEINERAARESALSFSYLLMQVAKIVNPLGSEQR